MQITVENLQKRIPINPTKIITITKKILKGQGIKKADISLVFVTNRKIQALNKQFLGRSYATDVIAFDLKDDFNSTRKSIDGEIVISATMAALNAKKYKTSGYRELVLYIVHGILHLLGYDDHKAADIKKMRSKEKEVMETLNSLISE